MEAGLDLSAETFGALCERFKPRITQWLQQDRRAQLRRDDDPSVMDIYDTTMAKGMLMMIYIWKSVIWTC